MSRTAFSQFLIALALFALLAFAASDPVDATEPYDDPFVDIYAVIEATTGIPRTIDAGLVAIAEQRAIEIQTDWSHAGKASPQEVLAYNDAPGDWASYAVGQWMGSPTHNWILLDPTLDLIGCAAATDSTDLHWVVCAFDYDDLVPLPGPNGCRDQCEEDESSTSCSEDDPCWDCSTMGNQQCGPMLPDTSIPPPAPDANWLVVVVLLLVLVVLNYINGARIR